MDDDHDDQCLCILFVFVSGVAGRAARLLRPLRAREGRAHHHGHARQLNIGHAFRKKNNFEQGQGGQGGQYGRGQSAMGGMGGQSGMGGGHAMMGGNMANLALG